MTSHSIHVKNFYAFSGGGAGAGARRYKWGALEIVPMVFPLGEHFEKGIKIKEEGIGRLQYAKKVLDDLSKHTVCPQKSHPLKASTSA